MQDKEQGSIASHIQRRSDESQGVIDWVERINAHFSQLDLSVS